MGELFPLVSSFFTCDFEWDFFLEFEAPFDQGMREKLRNRVFQSGNYARQDSELNSLGCQDEIVCTVYSEAARDASSRIFDSHHHIFNYFSSLWPIQARFWLEGQYRNHKSQCPSPVIKARPAWHHSQVRNIFSSQLFQSS